MHAKIHSLNLSELSRLSKNGNACAAILPTKRSSFGPDEVDYQFTARFAQKIDFPRSGSYFEIS